jgi:hypothetical protein
MRMFLACAFVAIVAMAGYAFRPVPVSAQSTPGDFLAFEYGRTVRLSVDLPEGVITCHVSQVQHGFIGCTGDDRFRRRDRWINLRFVKEITPIERP